MLCNTSNITFFWFPQKVEAKGCWEMFRLGVLEFCSIFRSYPFFPFRSLPRTSLAGLTESMWLRRPAAFITFETFFCLEVGKQKALESIGRHWKVGGDLFKTWQTLSLSLRDSENQICRLLRHLLTWNSAWSISWQQAPCSIKWDSSINSFSRVAPSFAPRF